MQHVLSSEELCTQLNKFHQTLHEFDYSDIKNIVFFNLEAVYTYIEGIEDNPFKRQYKQLQETLDYIQPYLPFLSTERASDFLMKMANVTDDYEIEQIKAEYTQKLRMDFIHTARKITDERDWNFIIEICEDIRSRKEEVYLN